MKLVTVVSATGVRPQSSFGELVEVFLGGDDVTLQRSIDPTS